MPGNQGYQAPIKGYQESILQKTNTLARLYTTVTYLLTAIPGRFHLEYSFLEELDLH